MLIRYLVLSPSEEARQEFLGGLFGSFELSPRGHGEKVVMPAGDGALEIIGTGKPGKLKDMALRIMESGVQVDGILVLVPSGDEDSWSEAKSITQWIQSSDRPVVTRTWVFGDMSDLEKEAARKALLALVSAQEQKASSKQS